MLTRLYIEALLTDKRAADAVWNLWTAGVITDDMAALAWLILVQFGQSRYTHNCRTVAGSCSECCYPSQLDGLFMKTDELRKDMELVALAERLRNQTIEEMDHPRSRLDELLRGIKLERERLGNRRFLAILLQYEFNIDGGYDWAWPLESFDSQAHAVLYVEAAAESLRKSQLEAGPDECGNSWALESVGKSPPRWQAARKLLPPIRVIYETAYKLRGKDDWGPSPVDSIYNCFQVLGNFEGPIVSDDLIDYIDSGMGLDGYFCWIGGDTSSIELLDAIRSAMPNRSIVEQ
jgi:hypothetical protein